MEEMNESKATDNTAEPVETMESLREQLNAAQQTAAEWQHKYEQAEAEHKAKDYNDKLDRFIKETGVKNSIYAEHLKRQIVEQNLQFDDKGVLSGGEAVVQAMRDSYPDAFQDKPFFVRSTASTSGHIPQKNRDLFRASFMSSTGFPKEAEPSRNIDW